MQVFVYTTLNHNTQYNIKKENDKINKFFFYLNELFFSFSSHSIYYLNLSISRVTHKNSYFIFSVKLLCVIYRIRGLIGFFPGEKIQQRFLFDLNKVKVCSSIFYQNEKICTNFYRSMMLVSR